MSIPYSRYIVGSIPWYSFLIVTGIVLAFFLGVREEKRLGLPKDTMIDVTLVAVPCGVIGARLYFVLMSWEQFSSNLISILYVWEGGIAIYGAIIGGALGVYVYCRRKKLSFLGVLDIIVPGLLLAQALGRWGNYFNMEAYGPVIENAAFQFFPIGVLIPTATGSQWHMATFFYESLWNALGFVALMGLRKKQTEKGDVFFWYLLIYGSGRFIIEQLRTDSLWLGSIRVSQYVSLLLCAIAAAMLLYHAARGHAKGLGLGVAAMGLALLRWFFLTEPSSYGFLMACILLSGSMLLWLRQGAFPLRPLLWLLPALVIDGLGLAASAVLDLSPAVGGYLHTLTCSLTLPLYALWFQQRFWAANEPEQEKAS